MKIWKLSFKKLNYMHPTPLKSGYVSMEELWKWSSVDNDSSELGYIDIMKLYYE